MTIRFSDETLTRLEELSRQTGKTKTSYIQQAVDLYLDNVALAYQADSMYQKVLKGQVALHKGASGPLWNLRATEEARPWLQDGFISSLAGTANVRISGKMIDGQLGSYWCYMVGTQAVLAVIDDSRSAILMLVEADVKCLSKPLDGSGEGQNPRNKVLDAEEDYQPMLSCGMRVRAIRRRKGITQKEFAKKLATSGSDLSFMESGKRPITMRMAKRMASVLGVPLKKILEG